MIVQVLIGAPVAGGLVGEVAVLALLLVAAPADDVHRGPPAAQLVQGGELAGRQRGGHEPGAVGEQHAQPLGVGHGVLGRQEAVGTVRVVAGERPVEPARLVGACDLDDVGGIVDGAGGRDDLRRLLGGDPPDELDGHGTSSAVAWPPRSGSGSGELVVCSRNGTRLVQGDAAAADFGDDLVGGLVTCRSTWSP